MGGCGWSISFGGMYVAPELLGYFSTVKSYEAHGQNLTIEQALALQSGEWSTDDALLKPILEDDPLLQLDFDWEEEEQQTVEQQLAQMKLELQAAQKVVKGVLGDDEPVEVKRDDDTHYFDSYAENGEPYLSYGSQV